jgi:hypothetical protein
MRSQAVSTRDIRSKLWLIRHSRIGASALEAHRHRPGIGRHAAERELTKRKTAGKEGQR